MLRKTLDFVVDLWGDFDRNSTAARDAVCTGSAVAPEVWIGSICAGASSMDLPVRRVLRCSNFLHPP